MTCVCAGKAVIIENSQTVVVVLYHLFRFGLSGGEFDSVLRAVGGVDRLIDWDKKSPEIDLMRYMDDPTAKEDKLFDHPELMKTPVVRNGRRATVGYCPDVWKQWEEEEK